MRDQRCVNKKYTNIHMERFLISKNFKELIEIICDYEFY